VAGSAKVKGKQRGMETETAVATQFGFEKKQ
jgi:hypothetical protein